jgi:dethiobiotin synthetase
LVIVARRGLGTLSHTLLTVEAARRRGLGIAGIILNAAVPNAGTLAEETNAEELVRHAHGVPILCEVDYCSDPWTMWERLRGVDWYGWARTATRPAS